MKLPRFLFFFFVAATVTGAANSSDLLKRKEVEIMKIIDTKPIEKKYTSTCDSKKEEDMKNNVSSLNKKLSMLQREFEALQEYTKDQLVITHIQERIVDIDSFKENLDQELTNAINSMVNKKNERKEVEMIAMQYWAAKKNPPLPNVAPIAILEIMIQKLSKENKRKFEEMNNYIEEYQKELDSDINEILTKTSNADKSKNQDEVEGSGSF